MVDEIHLLLYSKDIFAHRRQCLTFTAAFDMSMGSRYIVTDVNCAPQLGFLYGKHHQNFLVSEEERENRRFCHELVIIHLLCHFRYTASD